MYRSYNHPPQSEHRTVPSPQELRCAFSLESDVLPTPLTPGKHGYALYRYGFTISKKVIAMSSYIRDSFEPSLSCLLPSASPQGHFLSTHSVPGSVLSLGATAGDRAERVSIGLELIDTHSGFTERQSPRVAKRRSNPTAWSVDRGLCTSRELAENAEPRAPAQTH